MPDLLVVILGPTATGKSELGVKLAQKFQGEIVSADSRQIYKEMDVATAKPLRTQKSKAKNQKYIVDGIPHYLIDIVKPDQEFNVAVYKKLALKAIKDIQRRGNLPILVGGTGLYIWAVVDNLTLPNVPAQKKIRRELEQKNTKELFEIYKNLDPKGAEFIEKQNKTRLIRAIEVCRVTDKPFWQQRKKGPPLFKTLQIGIKLPQPKLKSRIIKRVERMFAQGLEKEVKNLVKKYGWVASLQTIGYQEWKSFFEGKIRKKEVKELIITHTLQFARRQMTWFKRDSRIQWLKNYKQAEELVKNFLNF